MPDLVPLIRPDDDANRELVSHVHPRDWENPTPRGTYNLVVIGAGTAGLVTAAGAAGLGARVALVERHLMGGDCLNVGCVPSKALIASAKAAHYARGSSVHGATSGDVDFNFAQAMARMRGARARIAPVDGAPRYRDELGVDVFLGDGRFVDSRHVEVDGERLRFARAVIATGARAFVPPIEGLEEAGYLTNETVFELTELPSRLVVVGGGPIGCELAQSFQRIGSDVTLVEAAPRILGNDDQEAAEVVAASLRADGVELLTGARLARVEEDRTCVVDTGDGERQIRTDHILIAVGRDPNVQGLGLETVGVESDRGGIVVDDQLRTTNRRVFAAGDCCSRWKFTHAADAMARIVIRNALFFGRARVSNLVIPWVTYTDPELAQVGVTPFEAAERGIAIDTFERDFSDVDRGITDGVEAGFVRIHTARGKDEIVGATIVGPHAGELIGELALAMTAGIGLGRIAETIHPYPTAAMAVKQVADQWSRTRLTPTVARLLRGILRWRRR